MSESFQIAQGSKKEQYESLIPQIKALVSGESDRIANMANICAALKEQFAWLWIGFYIVKEDQLVLGPFQGPIACTRIDFNKGVCGKCWAQGKTIIVPDVDLFPDHIVCSSLSRSEITVPCFINGQVVAILDIDSATLDSFDAVDQFYLEEMLSEWLA